MTESGGAPPIERRPLTSRDTAWARAAATFLVKTGASPNGISTVGGVFGILAGAAFAATRWTSGAWWPYVVAAAFIQLRLLCNLLDGMVAIEGGKRSAVGELFNEAPDRVSDVATLVGAGYAVGASPELGWAAGCVALMTAYVRALGKTAGAPNDFRGPMAKPHRMALMTATALALAFVPAAWLGDVPVMDVALWIVVIGGTLTAVRRLVRAARFLRARAA